MTEHEDVTPPGFFQFGNEPGDDMIDRVHVGAFCVLGHNNECVRVREVPGFVQGISVDLKAPVGKVGGRSTNATASVEPDVGVDFINVEGPLKTLMDGNPHPHPITNAEPVGYEQSFDSFRVVLN